MIQGRTEARYIQDILHSRARTTGIHETRFTLGRQITSIIDVGMDLTKITVLYQRLTPYRKGGQHAERRKWVQCFQDVTSVIFVASLSVYDELVDEVSEVVRRLL
jgi:hypothetical protein